MRKAEDFTLEQIQKHLRIEEETRSREKKNSVPNESNVHYVSGESSSKNQKLKAKKNDQQFKKKPHKKRSNTTKQGCMRHNAKWTMDFQMTFRAKQT